MSQTPTPRAEAGDLSVRAVWAWCAALYALYMIVALFWFDILRGPALHPSTGESTWEFGLLETTQNIFLAIALIMAGALFLRVKAPALLRAWLALVFLGVLYLLGEETSWGQHYLGWAADGWFAEFNDQQETNLHNTSALFDQLPRNVLYLGMIIGGVAHPLVKLWRGGRGLIDQPWWWAPTLACLPPVVFAFIAGAPKALDKLAGNLGLAAWENGFRLEAYVGRASEMEECFMYFFFIVYLWSLARRLKARGAQT